MADYLAPTLQQAATSPNVTGALQQLLLSRVPTPEQDQAQQANHKVLLGDYQSALRSDPSPGYNGLDHSLYSWIGQMGRNTHPAVSAMQGVAAGGKFMGDRAAALHSGDVAAAKAGLDDDVNNQKLDIQALRALGGGKGGAGGAGKYIQFSDDAGNKYIMNNATGAREVIPATKSKMWEAAHKLAFDKATSEGMDSPEDYAVDFANATVAKSPGSQVPNDAVQKPTVPVQPGTPAIGAMPQGAPNSAPSATLADRQFIVQQEWAMNKAKAEQFKSDPTSQGYQDALRNMSVARRELQGTYGVDPMKGLTAPPAAAVPPEAMPEKAAGITYRDKPKAALDEGEAGAIGRARGEEYKAVQQAAAAAESQLQAFNTLAKIKPNTNAAANAQEHIASLFNALGMDGNSPIIQNAIKNRESNQILDQLRNASLKAENGVQTKSDEDRIGREFPKTTDFSKAWDFGIKLGRERALRSQDRLKYYDDKVDGKSNIGKARSSWNTEYSGDPITQYLGGKLIFRTDFVDNYMRKYPDAGKQGAVAEWREMEKDYQARGGRK